ncbi:NUDIX hydrolase [Aldersonia kunmingensis]|uniref:NUDIX hydrolase n=1 Tax=Aldersonia kunmingensis TaxID=408066 RepID=UPI000831E70F|nr:NUDIX hydrolase [Aldersonia kunmingensis]
MNSTESAVAKANVFAAGAVLWRPAPASPDGIEVALIHRPRYDDWSFPKGKFEPGETAMMAAVREVAEEAGVECVLGRHVARVTYPVPGHRRLKRVDYWAARAVEGEFSSSDEVDKLLWIPPSRMLNELSYPMDRRVLRQFQRVPADTETLLLVRHAKAGRRKRYKGDDRKRPLDDVGRSQAQALVPNLLTFGATDVHSADRTRCTQTVVPLAAKLGVEISDEPTLSEEAYRDDPAAGRDRMRKIADKNGIRVVCSQGKVIPDLLAWWAEQDGVTLPPARNRKGSVWVLSLHDGKLVAADHLDSPFPESPAPAAD